MAGRCATTLTLKRQLPQADERDEPCFETAEIEPHELDAYLKAGWHIPDPEIIHIWPPMGDETAA
ncbi:hypothetical protein ACFSCV_01730 [Methylopila henanensis]|uniref:Uncharacterized protein n=1 Tax=Methylopila henanensis TaxID=873516 RepID=A0ABW4K0V2_9HYPH